MLEYLVFIATDIQGELDSTVRAEIGARAVARILHVFHHLVRRLKVELF
jgi:hypothetical protein